MDTDAAHPQAPGVRAAVLYIVYAVLAVYLIRSLVAYVGAGGDFFQQADWLINNSAGLVRRGLAGSAIFQVSGLTGIPALTIVAVLQGGLTLLIVLLTVWGLRRTGLPDRVMLLALSPAFLLFWGYDYQGAMRKEVLALAAVCLLLPVAAGARRAGLLVAVSAAVFALSVLAHEAMALFFPLYALALHTALGGAWGAARLRLALGLVTGLVGLSFLFSVGIARVSAGPELCAPLLAQGLDPRMCEGALAWAQLGLGAAVRTVFNALFFQVSAAQLLLALCLAATPLVVAVRWHPEPRVPILAGLAAGVSILPLLVVSLDWGRWFFLAVTFLSYALILEALRRRPGWLYLPLDRVAMAGAVLLVVGWSMEHSLEGPRPGLLAVAEAAVKGALREAF